MSIDFTTEQIQLISDACKWFNHNDSEQIFQYSAPAGAGKSTAMHAIIDALGLSQEQVAPMAYTGAATTIMRINGFSNACTIHSWLYMPVEKIEEDPVTKKLKKSIKYVFRGISKAQYKLICIDEGSMVPLHMNGDLLRNGIKVLVCGDLNQLPPVKDKPAFLVDGKVRFLTRIMRQSEGSAIVEFSQRILHNQDLPPGNYGDLTVIPANIFKQYEQQMIPQMDIVICGLNKTRDFYNSYIRENILKKGNSPLPTLGEKVICRKNNWEVECDGVNLTNGLSGTIMNMPSIHDYHSGSLFTIDFAPDLFPEIVFKQLDCDFKYFTSSTKMRYAMKEFGNPNYRPEGEKFEFSYAITTHLSQGSQFYKGIYIQEYFGGGPEMRKHLNYTGITRFRNKCIYVTPPIGIYIPIMRSVITINGKSVLE